MYNLDDINLTFKRRMYVGTILLLFHFRALFYRSNVCTKVYAAPWPVIPPYQQCGHVVHVTLVQVTEAVVGRDHAGETSVQSDVRLGVRSEHQEVGGIGPPANFLLHKMNRRVMPGGMR